MKIEYYGTIFIYYIIELFTLLFISSIFGNIIIIIQNTSTMLLRKQRLILKEKTPKRGSELGF